MTTTALSNFQIIDSFRAAMAAAGIAYNGNIEADADKITRFTVDGDRAKSLTGWYILHTDGSVPAGEFGCWKRGIQQTWCAKAENTLTDAEKHELAEKREADRKRREAEQAARYKRAAEQATIVWEAAAPATDEHPYLQRKGVKAHGLRVGRWTRVNDDGEVWLDVPDALLVPIYKSKGKLASLQAIFPERNAKVGRDKDFISGGEKGGNYFIIGTIDPTAATTIVFCEGYATGATIHEATGYPVVVCFDAGNLPAVASRIRKQIARGRFIIAADNDRWTLAPVSNPGVTSAQKAARDTGGEVRIPRFSCIDGKPTDFNDLAQLDGMDEVRQQIAQQMPESHEQGTAAPAGDAVVAVQAANDNVPVMVAGGDDGAGRKPARLICDESDPFSFFKILGYDRDEIYVFPYKQKQMTVISRRDLSLTTLISLAPLDVWTFGCGMRYQKGGGVNKDLIVNDIFRLAHQRPVFNAGNIRGKGAWRDAGRNVFHFGGYLLFDGSPVELDEYDSRFIYEAEKPFEIDTDVPELTDAEGRQLLEVADMLRWHVPASSALLAGWVALAPLCGALRWRPHIWLTGGAGCGKSTILERFVHHLTRWCNVYAQGNSSEAGIRQTIGSDAVPVLFDESEQNNEREAGRVQGILALIRQASSESGARTLKGTTQGTALNFHVRSMFCLASIQVGIQQQADRERLTVLSLRSKPEKGTEEAELATKQWEQVNNALYGIERDQTLPDRLFKRMMTRLDSVQRAIDVFVIAAGKHFGNQRDGDQYGTLLAGCWCLISNDEPSASDAAAMIAAFNWNEYTDDGSGDDAERAFHTLLESRIETHYGSKYSVFELCDRMAEMRGMSRNNASPAVCKMDENDIQNTLGRNGMKIKDDALLLANNSDALRKLFANTQYAADFRGLITRLPGVQKKASAEWISGKVTRCLMVPMSKIV